MRMKDKVVVVTGAARNNGLGIATRFAREGAAVVILDILAEQAQQSAEGLRKIGAKALAIECDVSDKRAVDATASSDPLRHANHACEPNMVLKLQQGRVAFYAIRDIAEGEELTARYGPTHHAGRLRCACGSPRCVGWI